jgi:predicted kinase
VTVVEQLDPGSTCLKAGRHGVVDGDIGQEKKRRGGRVGVRKVTTV